MTETANESTGSAELFDAPEDAADDVARGYAVYDRELGRYVTGLLDDKPSTADAKTAAKGHRYATVRV